MSFSVLTVPACASRHRGRRCPRSRSASRARRLALGALAAARGRFHLRAAPPLRVLRPRVVVQGRAERALPPAVLLPVAHVAGDARRHLRPLAPQRPLLSWHATLPVAWSRTLSHLIIFLYIV